jgi:hypothetical protein
MVYTDVDLFSLLDGNTPDGWPEFIHSLFDAARPIASPVDLNASTPFFLRTGHTSGKHQWSRTCYVADYLALEHHVAALVEESAMGFPSLPVGTWAVREMVPTSPICYCEGYGGMPVVREFRFFIRGSRIEHSQPYWPPDAVEQGQPDRSDWAERLEAGRRLSLDDLQTLTALTQAAAAAVGGGYWSVDFLQDEDGGWWLTDMAEGEKSFRYEPGTP